MNVVVGVVENGTEEVAVVQIVVDDDGDEDKGHLLEVDFLHKLLDVGGVTEEEEEVGVIL